MEEKKGCVLIPVNSSLEPGSVSSCDIKSLSDSLIFTFSGKDKLFYTVMQWEKMMHISALVRKMIPYFILAVK